LFIRVKKVCPKLSTLNLVRNVSLFLIAHFGLFMKIKVKKNPAKAGLIFEVIIFILFDA